jgi:hypothetical protein
LKWTNFAVSWTLGGIAHFSGYPTHEVRSIWDRRTSENSPSETVWKVGGGFLIACVSCFKRARWDIYLALFWLLAILQIEAYWDFPDSLWKGNSANFAFTEFVSSEFPEVRLASCYCSEFTRASSCSSFITVFRVSSIPNEKRTMPVSSPLCSK